MKKIFVTTDLSASSKAGIKFAIQLSKQLKAELIFYHVAEMTKPTSWADNHYRHFEKEKIDEKTAVLKRFVESTLEGTKPPANSKYLVQLSLNVDSSIITAAKKLKANFICMSTRGAGKVKKLFGTNASTIITTSPIPVIVIPQRYRVANITDIFFACDFAALNKEMKPIQELASELKAQLKVFHYDYLLNVPENARKLDRKADPFRSDKVSFHFRKLEVDHTLNEHLTTDIKKEKPSMVVLFTKQDRNWYDRLILPSEASEMSFHATLPLLTFKKKVR